MKSQFQHIGLITRPDTPNIASVIAELSVFLLQQQLNVYIDEQYAQQAEQPLPAGCQISSDLGRQCDLILVLGGDGTFLAAARQAAPYRVPLIGINQGHLGFLTQVTRENMFPELASMLTGKYLADECLVLEAIVSRDGETIHQALALNDVVLSRGGTGQMIEFEVSTPTGSTAYSLAAGGPILQTTLRAFTLVPICPQSMTNRPIVISDNFEIKILITKSRDARLHYDGQSFVDMQSKDIITLRRYHHHLRVLHPTHYQYYKTLRQKLHWGEQLI